MARFDDKIFLVSGAGSGIGRASAQAFADAGARVIALDRDRPSAEATATRIGGVAVAGDVADPATWDEVVAASEALGGLDGAHLNAGIYGSTSPIDELGVDTYRRTFAANVDGVVLGTRALVPLLRARGGGALVATASIAGLIAFAPNPVYTATKHAVVGFVQAMAPTLLDDNITFNAVCPAIVDTPMTVEATGGADLAALEVPLITPEAVAAAVLALAAGSGTGHCHAVLAGRDPIDWVFAGWADIARA